MSRTLVKVAAGGTVLVVAAVAVMVAMFLSFMDGTDDEGGCDTGGGTAVAADPVAASATVGGLDAEQSTNAATIITVGRQLGVPARGWLVAIATAQQEAGLRNLTYGDRDSLGIFQQRTGWGPVEQRTNVADSARMFFTGGQAGQRGLLDVPGWQSMSVAEAAQAVQVSAFPSAYARWEPLARSVVESLASGDAVDLDATSTVECTTMVAAGTVTYPIANGARYDRHNYGGNGSMWAHGHTGTDFSVACGSPVVAAHGGTVAIDTSQSWAGRWLVKITTGPSSLTTWYAHMQALDVTDGQTVATGQTLGQVGDLGNATGCHLHFEVHPRNGGIYEDGVNPSTWLERNVGRSIDSGVAPVALTGDSAAAGLRIATFNTLGASHTGPGGKAPGMASGAQRTVGLITLLDQYRVTVAGLQEFQSVQASTFTARASGTYAMWHPDGDTENAVIWRRDAFAFVGASTVTIPYFEGNPRRMPIVQLRDKTTGQVAFFLNVHNPADTAQHPRQARYRAEAVRREVAAVRDLIARYDQPVFVTGDMNDHADFYCPFTAPGNMTAAAGGSNIGGRCVPPPNSAARIDWVLGRTGTRWAGYTTDDGPLVDRTSDHPFVVTQAQVE